jgi:hypothetical protein
MQVLNVSAHAYSLKSSWRHYYISDVDDPFGDSPFASMSKPLYAIEEVALRFRYKVPKLVLHYHLMRCLDLKFMKALYVGQLDTRMITSSLHVLCI